MSALRDASLLDREVFGGGEPFLRRAHDVGKSTGGTGVAGEEALTAFRSCVRLLLLSHPARCHSSALPIMQLNLP